MRTVPHSAGADTKRPAAPETMPGQEPTGPSLWRGTTRSQLATSGLVIVLLAVSAFAVWSALWTNRLGEQAIASNLLADRYAAAAAALAEQVSLAARYRLEPGPQMRSRLDGAAEKLKSALASIADRSESADQATARRLLEVQAAYQAQLERMMAAVDRGDQTGASLLDKGEIAPMFSLVENMVGEAAARYHAESMQAVQELGARGAFNAKATPAVFVLGLALVGIFSSVLRQTKIQLTHQRAQALHASLHDALTGLPNRTLLSDRFAQALRASRRDGFATGLLLLDLDRFKEVNDTLGHHYGDRLLVQIGVRLAGALREVDTIARLGGDEFAVLLPSVKGLDGALEVGRRLRAAMLEPFDIDGVVLEIEASIGVVISGQHGNDPATLMQRADMAMYEAKQKGQGVGAYSPDIDQHSPERLAMLGQLRRGIAQGELFLHYQPKISLDSSEVIGVEALVRWKHPERGLVRPDEFIPFAEHTGLVGPLTRCVLDLALAQVRRWADAGHRIPVAVNISTRNLLDDSLVNQVSELLARHGVSARMLKLELTESAIMLEPQRAAHVLGRLHALGVRIAIDDFGAGYTSLAQLKTLPIDELKIDKSFVMTMQTDRSNALIVNSVVELGHNLGMRVVAEGVECAAALGALSGYGCDVAQGYHLCRPQTADAFLEWLDEHGNLRAWADSALPSSRTIMASLDAQPFDTALAAVD